MEREVLGELSRTGFRRMQGDQEGLALERELFSALRQDFDSRPNDYQTGVHLLQLASDLEAREPAGQGYFATYLPRVEALAPRRLEASLLAGAHAFRLGDVAEGRRQYERAARLNPKLAFPYWALGRDLVHAGLPVQGRPMIEEALRLGYDFRSPGALTTLIRLYHGVGDTARAREFVGIARNMFPAVLDSSITP
jgi:tetratricopeptide (TPR) repeat protein